MSKNQILPQCHYIFYLNLKKVFKFTIALCSLYTIERMYKVLFNFIETIDFLNKK